jgi:hypothetical protein
MQSILRVSGPVISLKTAKFSYGYFFHLPLALCGHRWGARHTRNSDVLDIISTHVLAFKRFAKLVEHVNLFFLVDVLGTGSGRGNSGNGRLCPADRRTKEEQAGRPMIYCIHFARPTICTNRASRREAGGSQSCVPRHGLGNLAPETAAIGNGSAGNGSHSPAQQARGRG